MFVCMPGKILWALGGLVVCSWFSLPARAEIYVYRDGRGGLHFSNAPVSPGYRPYMPEENRSSIRGRIRLANLARRQAFYPMIREAARRHQVEVALVKAVIQAESDFVPYARSPKGAMGMMQLMPGTARRHNVWQILDPRENIEGGVAHLRLLLDRYAGNVRLALAAYNAGVEAVEKYGGVPPYKETTEYLDRVLRFRQQYLLEQ